MAKEIGREERNVFIRMKAVRAKRRDKGGIRGRGKKKPWNKEKCLKSKHIWSCH